MPALLAALLVFGLAGCGGSGREEAPKMEEQASEPTQPPEETQPPETVADWRPDGAVNLIVPYEAGSLNDITARVLAQYLEKYVGQSVTVENIPGSCGETAEGEESPGEDGGESAETAPEEGAAEEGGGEEAAAKAQAGPGTLGWAELAKRDGDGLTLGYVKLPDFTNALVQRPDVCALEDYTPICTHTTQTAVIVARRDDGRFSTLEELVTYGKKDPGSLIAATDGEFGLGHGWTQLLCKDAHIGYTADHRASDNEALQSLRSGETDFCVTCVDNVLEQDEELLVLGVFAQERLPQYPDVPTLKELGYYDKWQGCAYCVVAPAGIPADAVAFYENAFRDTMADPQYRSASTGVVTEFKNAAETAELIDQQRAFSIRTAGSLWQTG